MLAACRFLWTATSGYRLLPWRSPYLRWRIETYSGLHADRITFREFWGFVWRERRRLWHFLKWVEQMEMEGRRQKAEGSYRKATD